MIEQIRHLEGLVKADLPRDEFVIINSAWDLLLSAELWKSRFSDRPVNQSFGLPGPYERRIRIHALEGGNYSKMTSARNNDQAVYEHRIVLEDFPFIEPKLYFQYMMARFGKNKIALEQISWWRRNRWVNPSQRKLFHKLKKDSLSISLLTEYFRSGFPENGLLANITADQWGYGRPELKSLFPDSLNS